MDVPARRDLRGRRDRPAPGRARRRAARPQQGRGAQCVRGPRRRRSGRGGRPDERRPRSQAYDVTGAELLDASDLARIGTAVTGKPVTVIAVDDAAYIAGLVQHAGLPEPVAATLATFGQAIREGHLGQRTDVVERLTGRPATPFEDVLRASLPVAA